MGASCCDKSPKQASIHTQSTNDILSPDDHGVVESCCGEAQRCDDRSSGSTCCGSDINRNEDGIETITATERDMPCGADSGQRSTTPQKKCCLSSEDDSNSGCGIQKGLPNARCASPKSITKTAIRDLEHGSAGDTETVSFLVSGMTCTGCVDKLVRLFDGMPGVSNPSINFVMGSGKVDIDNLVTNADDMIRFAISSTGFGISKVIGGHFYIDVLAPAVEGERLARIAVPGMISIETLDKNTQRLFYNPMTIGARRLLSLVDERYRNLAPPQPNPQLLRVNRRLRDQMVKTLLAAILTIPVVIVSWSHDLVEEHVKITTALVFGTLVQIIAIPEFYRPALAALWYSNIVEMDMLVVISITAAYLYSLVASGFAFKKKPLDEGPFFEASTMLITLILLGRLVATYARVSAVSAVSLRSKQESSATVVTTKGIYEIDARLLQYGDKFQVLPHSRIPTDGMIIEGETEVDESMLTGESMPVVKKVGDTLIAGTINGDCIILARLTRLPNNNTMTDIAQLVEDASNSKPKIQDLANKVAGWFVPVMILVALLVLAIWLGYGLGIKKSKAGKSIGNAITHTVAVLAVACPCALGLAVPMVLVVAGGIAARNGVVIKSASVTDGARKTTDVVFDKTGTITEDRLSVVEQIIFHDDESEVIAIVKAMVADGKHPISAAIDRHLRPLSVKQSPELGSVRVIPGAGIEAQYRATKARAGNVRWTKTATRDEISRLQKACLSILAVTLDNKPAAIFGLSARIRPEAKAVIDNLKARGIVVHFVSGDQIAAVESVANIVGISLQNVAGERSPSEKRDYITRLMEDTTKKILFCGDGTNDAVAVAQADIGVQISGGLGSSDVTQGAADVVLLNGLEGIPFLLDISKAAYRRMCFNFIWSGIYNLLAVTLASGAWVLIRIHPRWAGLGEMVSVVPVIVAAMSLFLFNLGNKDLMMMETLRRKLGLRHFRPFGGYFGG